MQVDLSMAQMKAAVRRDIKKLLAPLTKEFIKEQSDAVYNRLVALEPYASSKSLSVYLSMNGEIDTRDIVNHSLLRQKRLFIPKIVGKRSEDMFMFEVRNRAELDAFPLNSWGIPEPVLTTENSSRDGTYHGDIDCILVPGVAFDNHCRRLGHGKGYYDCFIRRLLFSRGLLEHCDTFDPIPRITGGVEEQRRPVLIGLALDEQIVDEVPVEDHDFVLDYVVTPTRMFSARK